MPTNCFKSTRSLGPWPSFIQVLPRASQKHRRWLDDSQLRDLGETFVDSHVAATMHPRRNHDRRPAHTRETVNQHVSSLDADCNCEHDVLELLRGERARVRDRDIDIGDFRSFAHDWFFAKRNHGSDAQWIHPGEMIRIF